SGNVVAGPFRLALPAGSSVAPGQALAIGVRPEDFVLEGPTGSGVAVQVSQVTDLGHYHRVSVDVPDVGAITVFTDKSHGATPGPATLRPRRVLFYRDDRLVGTTEQNQVASRS